MYSLEKMIALGIEENLDLMTEQTTLKISSEEQTQANSPLWPSATVSMTQSQTEASSGITTDSFSTTLNAGYTFSWYNWILSRQSKTSYSMQEVKLSQIKNQIIFQIRAAYFELIRQNYSLRVLKDAFDRTKERLKVVQDGFELGQRPELELLEAQQSQEQARQDLLSSFFSRQQASSNLAILLNWDPLITYQIELRFPQESIGFLARDPKIVDAYLEKILPIHPDIRQQELAIQQTEEAVDLARSSFAPTLGISAGYTWSDDAFTLEEEKRSRSLSLTFNLPLFNGFQHSSTLQKANFNVEKTRLQYQKIRSLAIKEVVDVLTDVNQAASSIDVAQLQVQAAEKAHNIQKDLFQIGRVTNSDLEEKSLALTKAKLQWLQRLYDYNLSLANFEKVITIPLDWSKVAEEQTFLTQ